MLANHGVMVIGTDVADAWQKMYFFERACQVQVLAQSTGQPLDSGQRRDCRAHRSAVVERSTEGRRSVRRGSAGCRRYGGSQFTPSLRVCPQPPRRRRWRPSRPASKPGCRDVLARRNRLAGRRSTKTCDGPMEQIGRLVLGGGKRLRPSFCHWGFVGAGGQAGDQRIIDAGAALELMHAFALFHDDVMDDAGSRRGTPTTHTVFADAHAAAGWAGESRRFGEGVAILVGDLAFVMADQLLIDAPRDAWVIWNELRTELNIGQLLDIVGSVQGDRRLDKAERICRYKSGKYTVERPLHLGAVLAAPDRAAELLPALSAYGLPLGDAFQMRDDVMGAFGDEAVTGKPVGGDLREGKPTPLACPGRAGVGSGATSGARSSRLAGPRRC